MQFNLSPFDIYLTFCALVVGLLVGSFLNVVIYRLPIHLFRDWREQAREILIEHGELKKESTSKEEEKFNIAFPASHCPQCKAPIKPWHNIPLVSYFILLKGKCASCKTHISLRYPIVELVTGLLTAFSVLHFGASEAAALFIVFSWSLIALTMIDADHHILPDNITLPLLWLGILANIFGLFTDLESAVIGAVAGYLSLWSVYWLFKLIMKKEGMGYGDFKLLAALGAWMGWQSLPLIIILSSFVGAVIGIAGILVFNRSKDNPIPFGPYLAIAGWIAFIWGDAIQSTYIQMLK